MSALIRWYYSFWASCFAVFVYFSAFFFIFLKHDYPRHFVLSKQNNHYFHEIFIFGKTQNLRKRCCCCCCCLRLSYYLCHYQVCAWSSELDATIQIYKIVVLIWFCLSKIFDRNNSFAWASTPFKHESFLTKSFLILVSSTTHQFSKKKKKSRLPASKFPKWVRVKCALIYKIRISKLMNCCCKPNAECRKPIGRTLI